jgi:2-iminobutanoate/2-iminopropanoate deaminase
VPHENPGGLITHGIHDIGVARHLGRYSDAIEAGPGSRWLYSSGTPGIKASGEMPADIESQSRVA